MTLKQFILSLLIITPYFMNAQKNGDLHIQQTQHLDLLKRIKSADSAELGHGLGDAAIEYSAGTQLF